MWRRRRTARRSAAGIVAVLTIASASQIAASAAQATHIPGAAYTGTHAGGGAVSLVVSAGGSGITSFRVVDVPGNSCTFSKTITFSPPVRIVKHSFSYGEGPAATRSFQLQGTFSTRQGVHGTVFFQTLSGSTCYSLNPNKSNDPNVPWQARTTARPPACVVPNVKGKTLAAATAAITKAHCTVGRTRKVYSEGVARGRIVAQAPQPGARRPNGAKVDLVVSRGRRR